MEEKTIMDATDKELDEADEWMGGFYRRGEQKKLDNAKAVVRRLGLGGGHISYVLAVKVVYEAIEGC